MKDTCNEGKFKNSTNKNHKNEILKANQLKSSIEMSKELGKN